jgi:hypothetical protein
MTRRLVELKSLFNIHNDEEKKKDNKHAPNMKLKSQTHFSPDEN